MSIGEIREIRGPSSIRLAPAGGSARLGERTMSHLNPLTCYRCGLAAEPTDTRCSRCSLTLDWAAISDLRSLDYLRSRIVQWQNQGVVGPTVAQRMLGEAEHNRITILRMLAGVAPPPVPVDRPSLQPALPPPDSGGQLLPPASGDLVTAEPPSFFASGQRPVSAPPAPFPQREPGPPRRSFIDALVDALLQHVAHPAKHLHRRADPPPHVASRAASPRLPLALRHLVLALTRDRRRAPDTSGRCRSR